MAKNKIFSLKSSHLKKVIKTIILKTKCKININLRKYFETCYINSYINQLYWLNLKILFIIYKIFNNLL